MISFACPVCGQTVKDAARCPACGHEPAQVETVVSEGQPLAEVETVLPTPPPAGNTGLPSTGMFAGQSTVLPRTTPYEPAPPSVSPAPRAEGASPPGYEVEAQLGRGGMGVVYKARQTALGRTVALKMIRAGTDADPEELKRFQTEAEAIARLSHPNIVAVHEVGTHLGQPFFSLEFCVGGSLDKKLNGTPWQPKAATRLVETLARAMHAAHEAKVIHRDLKPANVLLAADGTPKITDFGLAKKLDDDGQTRTGVIMGTPSYMAPEQAEGRKEVGPLADVYSLGAILYELLTGRPPFKAAKVIDTVKQVINDDPVPLTQLNRSVPRDLETICLKCLRKEPGKRYGSARELAEDLVRFGKGEAIAARPVGRMERGVKWVRRNPVVAALTVAVLLVLLIGVGVSSYFAVAAAREAGQARRNEKRARQKETEANAASKRATEQQQLAEQRARDEARAREDEAIARAAAQEETRRAEREKKRAEEQLDRAEELVYADKLALAQQAYQEGNNWLALRYLEECPWNRRGWEHHHLWTRYNAKQTLKGHTSAVSSVSFSPDGKRLVSASRDGTVRLWDAHSGKEALTLKGHTSEVTSVCFSPDGKRLASASQDRTVRIWDAGTGQEVFTLKGHTRSVSSVCFSPDGKRLASASYDRTVRVWDAEKGQELLTLKGHTYLVHGVCFSPYGKRLASAGEDSTVRVWDAERGRELFTLKGHIGPVMCVCFSPDGKRLVSASGDRTVRIWDASKGQSLLTLRGTTGTVYSVCFSPDGKRLVSGEEGGSVRMWAADTGQEILTLKGHTGRVYSVCFSPDGKHLASAGEDRTLRVWDADKGQELLTLRGPTGMVYGVCFSSDGKRLASASNDRTVRIWDSYHGQEALILRGHMDAVRGVCFSPDGKRLASASYDRTVRLWDAEKGQELFTLKGHTGWVNSVCFSPDSKRLASAGNDRTVRLWDADTGQVVLILKGHTSSVSSVCFSPDGKRLASAGGDGTVRIWDPEKGQEALTLKGHTGVVSSVCFSQDGKRLASAGGASRNQPGEVKVWDTEKGQAVLTLKGHTSMVSSVCFGPDGKRLASAGIDQTIRIWDAGNGQELLTLKGHTRAVSSVCFSPDGKRLVSASEDGTMCLWDADKRQEDLTLERHTNAVTGLCFSPDGKELWARDKTNKVLAWSITTGQLLTSPSNQLPTSAPEATSPDGRLHAYLDFRGDPHVTHLAPSRPAKLSLAVPPPGFYDFDRAYHLRQAGEGEYGDHAFAAAFHIGWILRHQPHDAALHVRQAHLLASLSQREQAITHLLHALFLDPHVSLFPLDPGAAARAQTAIQFGDWKRAARLFERAARQPGAPLGLLVKALLVHDALGNKQSCQQLIDELLRRGEKDAVVQNEAISCLEGVPCSPESARILLSWTDANLKRQRNAVTLHRHGVSLYRVGRYAEAARLFADSVQAQGKGGFVDTWLFQARVAQQLGQIDQARSLLKRFESWYARQFFRDWQSRVKWQAILNETRRVVNTPPEMPYASEGP